MRTPSRFMPEIAQKRPSLGAWIVFAVLLIIFAHLLWMYPIPVIGFISSVGLVSFFQSKRTQSHLRRLAAQRAGQSICTFARQANCRINDTWVVRAVYEQVQSCLGKAFHSFPVGWADSFETDLKIDWDDVADVIAVEVAERTGRNYSNTTANPMYGKVRTVGDLVLFFGAQPIDRKLP